MCLAAILFKLNQEVCLFHILPLSPCMFASFPLCLSDPPPRQTRNQTCHFPLHLSLTLSLRMDPVTSSSLRCRLNFGGMLSSGCSSRSGSLCRSGGEDSQFESGYLSLRITDVFLIYEVLMKTNETINKGPPLKTILLLESRARTSPVESKALG